MANPLKVSSRTERASRLRLDAALEAAEDGHVAGLQVRSALWREEAQHDVRESGPHGCQCGLAGVDAGHVPEEDPRLSPPARRWTCDRRWDKKEAQTHTKHNMTVAVAVSTVAVVVLSPMSSFFIGVTKSPAKRRRKEV